MATGGVQVASYDQTHKGVKTYVLGSAGSSCGSMSRREGSWLDLSSNLDPGEVRERVMGMGRQEHDPHNLEGRLVYAPAPQDESAIELIIPAVQGTALIAMPIWVMMSRRFGKKLGPCERIFSLLLIRSLYSYRGCRLVQACE